MIGFINLIKRRVVLVDDQVDTGILLVSVSVSKRICFPKLDIISLVYGFVAVRCLDFLNDIFLADFKRMNIIQTAGR